MKGKDLKKRLAEVAAEAFDKEQRVYVDDPSEAPEGVSVREGDRGGTWYPASEASGTDESGETRDARDGDNEDTGEDGRGDEDISSEYSDLERGTKINLFGEPAQITNIDEFGLGDVVDVTYENGRETTLEEDRAKEILESGEMEVVGQGEIDGDDGDEIEVSSDIEEVTRDVSESFGMTEEEINSGRCMDWAYDVVENLDGEAEIVETAPALGTENAHWFVEHDGKYYDAESPEGVDDWRELDIWDRAINLPDLSQYEVRGDTLVSSEEDIVENAVDVVKDWVADPTVQAPNRWVNTQTGEYRYQENKPTPGEGGGDDDEQGDDETSEDVEYVETPYGEVPDTDGPLPPGMRDEPIGSDSHPVLWKEPANDEELEEYISEIQETEWYGEGNEIFQKAFNGPENTENYHTDDEGNWDGEREQKHEEWAEELVNEDAATDEDEQPIGMVLLGPPGAGKGWWQEQVEDGAYGETGEFVERDFTHISSDKTKEPIPEYEETNASEVHDEASKIAKENLAPKAIENQHNVIIDKVATSPDSTLDMVESMREQGYDVRANFVNVPTEKSVHNAVSRYYEEGRFTPLDFVNGAGKDSRESFNTILDETEIPESKIGRFDNDVEWGNAPDAEYLGEELLKVLMGRLETFLTAPGEQRREGKEHGRTSRRRRDRSGNSEVHGGGLRGSGRGGNRECGRGTGRRDDRITFSDLVKEVEQIFVENVHEAPDDKVVHVDPDDEAEERMYYIAEKAAEVVNEKFSKTWVEDDTPEAQDTRWYNTETGEYRYQPTKPESEGGEGDGDESVEVDGVEWGSMPEDTSIAFDTADGDWMSGDFVRLDEDGNAVVEGHENGEEWIVSPDDATNVMLPEDLPDNDDDEAEDEGEEEVTGIDIDRDDFRRIAIGQLFEDESDKLDDSYLEIQTEDGVEIREVDEVVNDPTMTFGDRAGYIELDDGSYMNLMGDMHENMPDGVEEEDIIPMTDADGLVPGDPDPSGSQDVNDWNVDWTETIHSNHGDQDEEPDNDLRRLNSDQKRRFRNEWEEVAPEEGIEEVATILKTIKGSTFNERGAQYDKLVMEAFGIDGETRSGVEARGGEREIDPDEVPDVSEEALEAFEIFSAASQKFYEENFGEDGTLHRGMGQHAVDEMAPSLAERIADESDEPLTVRDNPASVFTTDESMARSYDKGLVVHRDIESDDVFAMPEALLNMEHSAGPDWNEGEVNVNGWDQEVSLEEVEVDSTGTTYQEVVEDPVDTFINGGDRVFEKVVNVANSDPEAAYKLWRKVNDIPSAPSSIIEEENERAWNRLKDAAQDAIKADDGSGVVDIRSDADWLSEAAEDVYGDEDDDEEDDGDGVRDEVIENAVRVVKGRVYVDDPSEVPDDKEPQRGEQDGTYYVTDDGEDSDDEDEGDGFEAGDEIEIEGFNGPEEVTVVENPPSPGFLVEDESGEMFNISPEEVIGDAGAEDVEDEELEDWRDPYESFTYYDEGQEVAIATDDGEEVFGTVDLAQQFRVVVEGEDGGEYVIGPTDHEITSVLDEGSDEDTGEDTDEDDDNSGSVLDDIMGELEDLGPDEDETEDDDGMSEEEQEWFDRYEDGVDEDYEPEPVGVDRFDKPYEDLNEGNVKRYKREALTQLSKGHDNEAVDQVRNALEGWGAFGYESIQSVQAWAGAAEATGSSAGKFNEEVEKVSDEVIDAMQDFMEISQETARERFGDTFEVYRGYSETDLIQHTEKFMEVEDGEVSKGRRIEPLAMESWTVDEDTAKGFGQVAVKREVSVEEVGFLSGLFMTGEHKNMKEVTLAQDGPYEVEDDQVISGLDHLFKDDEEGELKPMPMSSANWLWEATHEDDMVEQAVQKVATWIPLASENPDSRRERVDADWNEVEDEENLADKFVERLVGKNWIEDPTEDAPNRWTNTVTGEYRYQETKPGSGGEGEGSPQDSGETGAPDDFDPEENWVDTFEVDGQVFDDLSEINTEEELVEVIDEGDSIVYEDYNGEENVGQVTEVEQTQYGHTVHIDGPNGNTNRGLQQEGPRESIVGVETALPDEAQDEVTDENDPEENWVDTFEVDGQVFDDLSEINSEEELVEVLNEGDTLVYEDYSGEENVGQITEVEETQYGHTVHIDGPNGNTNRGLQQEGPRESIVGVETALPDEAQEEVTDENDPVEEPTEDLEPGDGIAFPGGSGTVVSTHDGILGDSVRVLTDEGEVESLREEDGELESLEQDPDAAREPVDVDVPNHVEVNGFITPEAAEDIEEHGDVQPGTEVSFTTTGGVDETGTVEEVEVGAFGDLEWTVSLDGGGEMSIEPGDIDNLSIDADDGVSGGEEDTGEDTSDDEEPETTPDAPPVRGFDDYTEEYNEELNETLDDLAEDGHLEHVDRIKHEPDLEANGIYLYSVKGGGVSGTIEVRDVTDFYGRDGYMEEQQAEMYEADGINSTSNQFHTVLHEIGHASHLGGMGRREHEEAERQELRPNEKEIADELVSEQAAKNNHEFVAEVFAMKAHGKEVPDEVQDIYERFGGPEL